MRHAATSWRCRDCWRTHDGPLELHAQDHRARTGSCVECYSRPACREAPEGESFLARLPESFLAGLDRWVEETHRAAAIERRMPPVTIEIFRDVGVGIRQGRLVARDEAEEARVSSLGNFLAEGLE